MKNNSSTTFIIIATLAAAGGAYWYFFTGTGNESPITASTIVNEAQTEFQTLLGQLEPIKFDTNDMKIFSDPRFNALVDITVPISPEPIGRLDPFASIASGGSMGGASAPKASGN